MSDGTPFSFDGWADIQFMGHVRRVGKVRTSEIGGTAIFVVETPAIGGGFDQRIFAASALYSLQPLSEEIARALAGEINPAPVNPYELPNEWRIAIQEAEKTRREQAMAIEAERRPGEELTGFFVDVDDVGDWEGEGGRPRSCRSCGCTDDDCSGCVERTGVPCFWVEPDLCSACAADKVGAA